MATAVPFNVPFRTGSEHRYVQQVLEGRGYGGDGPFARRCQNLLQELIGAPRVYLTTSCTAALEMAGMLLDLQPGDEFLVPSYTFVASASAFMRCGAKPVFVDIDESTMMMDLNDLRAKITPRCRLIVPVHYGGVGCDMEGVMAIAREFGLQVVEDAAQAFDATVNGRPLGTFAPLGTLSFHETKNLHCGLGGALIVNDPNLIDRADALWQRGTDRTRMLRGAVDKYTWVTVGSSFYPTEFQAAFLLDQLEHVHQSTRERGRVTDIYRRELAPLFEQGRFVTQVAPPVSTTNHHCFYLLLPTEAERESLRRWLQGQGISAYTHYVPLHSSPVGLGLGNRAEDLPVTESAANRLLRLPMYASLASVDVLTVTDAIAGWAAER